LLLLVLVLVLVLDFSADFKDEKEEQISFERFSHNL